MSWKKRDIVNAALEEIGLASYVFDLEPEELESVMRAADSMAAQWDSRGVRLGWPLTDFADGSGLDQETNMPDHAVEAFYTSLAVRIAPRFGKQLSKETKVAAKSGFRALLALYAQSPKAILPSHMPRGAGYKTYRDRGSSGYFQSPPEDIDLINDDTLDLE